MVKEGKVVKKEKKVLTPEQARLRTLLGFYKKVPKPVASVMRTAAKKLRLVGLEGIKAILAAGKILADTRQVMHDKFKSGQEEEKAFVRWLKMETLGFSVSTAYNWMRCYDYARRFGTTMVERLGVRMLSGASAKSIAQRLLKAGDLSPKQQEAFASEVKREYRAKATTGRERKKLMKRTIKAVMNEAKRNIRAVVTERLTDAEAQVRAIVSFCRDMLKEIGAEKEWVVIERKELRTTE